MLPVVDEAADPVRRREAYAAGIRHMIFVTGRSKRAIEDHFDTAYELENEAGGVGQARSVGAGALGTTRRHGLRLRAPATLARHRPRRAVRRAASGQRTVCRTAGRRPDDGAPRLARRRAGTNSVQAFRQQGRSLLAVQEVPADQVHRYGIVA